MPPEKGRLLGSSMEEAGVSGSASPAARGSLPGGHGAVSLPDRLNMRGWGSAAANTNHSKAGSRVWRLRKKINLKTFILKHRLHPTGNIPSGSLNSLNTIK